MTRRTMVANVTLHSPAHSCDKYRQTDDGVNDGAPSRP